MNKQHLHAQTHTRTHTSLHLSNYFPQKYATRRANFQT